MQITIPPKLHSQQRKNRSTSSHPWPGSPEELLTPKYQLSIEEEVCETEPHGAAACLPTTLGLSWRTLHCSRCPQADGRPTWAWRVLWDVGTLGTAYGTWSSWKPIALFGNDVPWGWHWLLAARRTWEHCRNLNRPAAVNRMMERCPPTDTSPASQAQIQGGDSQKQGGKKTKTPQKGSVRCFDHISRETNCLSRAGLFTNTVISSFPTHAVWFFRAGFKKAKWLFWDHYPLQEIKSTFLEY